MLYPRAQVGLWQIQQLERLGQVSQCWPLGRDRLGRSTSLLLITN